MQNISKIYEKRNLNIARIMFFTLFSLMLILIVFCLADSSNTVFMMSIIAFCGSVIFLHNMGLKLLSFPIIFLVLIFFFHCSYYVLWLFQYKIADAVIYFITDEMWVEACKFSIIFILVYSFGVGSTKRKNNSALFIKSLSNEEIQRAGVMMVEVFLIPRIFVDVSLIIAFLRGGYLATFSALSYGFLEVFAEGFYFGIIFSIIGYRDNYIICKRILLFSMLIALIGMISGRRLEKVVFLVAIVLIYFKYVNRVAKSRSLSKKILICFACYTLLAFIATFGDFRNGGDISFTRFLTLFFRNFSYKMIVDQMVEFGYTSYTLAASMATFPKSGFGHGMNYLTSWIQVIPNIGGLYSPLIRDMSFVYSLPSKYQFWLGGSLLGELYYNFGYYSVLLTFVLGKIIRRISYNVDDDIYGNSFSIKSVISIILIPLFFVWVRGDFSYIPRPLVWYALIVIIFSRFRIKGNRQ